MPPTIFSQAQLRQLVTDTIPTDVPIGHHSAVVGAVDQNGVHVVAKFALPTSHSQWQLQAAWEHDWTTSADTVGAQVLLSW